MRLRDEKLHAVVARSAFPSQNVQSTMFGPLLEVVMSKKVHVVVARSKLPSQNAQNTSCFGSCDVEKVHVVAARSTFRSQKCKNTRGSEHFWTFRCRFAWQAQGIMHLVKSEQNVMVL